jgi:hypothetical protein
VTSPLGPGPIGLRTDVSALYIDPRGPYPKLLADCWDEARDARNYAGPNPVVAHPPCGQWSTLRTLSHEVTRPLAILGLYAVEKWGGVFEHPITSQIWVIRAPTLVVNQCDWGHPARKRTGLHIVGTRAIPPMPPPRKPTHWCSGVHTKGARGETPPGIKVCSAQQRRRTPIAFAQWLIELAATAREEAREAGSR